MPKKRSVLAHVNTKLSRNRPARNFLSYKGYKGSTSSGYALKRSYKRGKKR